MLRKPCASPHGNCTLVVQQCSGRRLWTQRLGRGVWDPGALSQGSLLFITLGPGGESSYPSLAMGFKARILEG